MTEVSTAGWYPDPEGRGGLERWWNGLGWSESVRPVPGSGATMTAYAPEAAPNLDPYELPDEGSGPAYAGFGSGSDPYWGAEAGRGPAALDGRKGRPGSIGSRHWAGWAGWVAGVVALALLIAVVVIVGGSNDPAPAPTTAGIPTAGTTRPPGQTRVVDEAAGLAYPFLGPYWLEFVNEVTETTSTAGEYIVTQDVVPGGGQFIAQVTSGPLQPIFGYAGTSTFASTIVAVQQSVRTRYYPLPNTIKTLRDEPITLDGAQAYLLEFDLAWDVAGYDSTGERAALILIDTGRPAPALMYISIPNTHAELYGIVDQVIGEIDVLP